MGCLLHTISQIFCLSCNYQSACSIVESHMSWGALVFSLENLSNHLGTLFWTANVHLFQIAFRQAYLFGFQLIQFDLTVSKLCNMGFGCCGSGAALDASAHKTLF